MCGPPAFALAAAAVTAAGTMYSGLQAGAQAGYESKVARQNAGIALEQAQDAIERGRRDQMLLGRRTAELKGRQAATMAANGVDLGFGSALDVQRDTQMIAGEDSQTLSENTRREVRGFEMNALNFRSEAAAARLRRKGAITSGAIGAASSLLSGASQFGQIKSRLGG